MLGKRMQVFKIWLFVAMGRLQHQPVRLAALARDSGALPSQRRVFMESCPRTVYFSSDLSQRQGTTCEPLQKATRWSESRAAGSLLSGCVPGAVSHPLFCAEPSKGLSNR